MSKGTLRDILQLNNRHTLFEKILFNLRKFSNSENIDYFQFETSEGIIPLIRIAKSLNIEQVDRVKVFLGAQHNEYNGLFGIIEFLNVIRASEVISDEIQLDNQIIFFAPLMNPYGFLHPKKENKSGYYLRNNTNLNRFWRRTFAPEYKNGESDLNKHLLPEHTMILKKMLEKFWKRENIHIYFLDFHETSLLKRHSVNLINNLKEKSITYKFSHWLEEEIIRNIIHLYEIPISMKPLYYRCNPNTDHTHLSLSFKQIDIVYERLQEYIENNNKKLPFYFCYSQRSKEFCEKLANNIYLKLKDILWETKFPAYNHYFNDHGCLVNMNDATHRTGVFSIELESEKHFFNIFDEIHKSKNETNYLEEKLKIMNKSIQLVVASIREMVNLY
ncbi:MAG: hypothetical protein ACXAEX_02330 [Promethearchaeota archaeon]|jgi:hypothetical protein